jgi:hypothetical protein
MQPNARVFGQRQHRQIDQVRAGVGCSSSQVRFHGRGLHFLSDQSEIVELGKIAIAHEIIKAERNSHLYGALLGDDHRMGLCKGTWANSFLGVALSGSRRQDIGQLFGRVTIIDFNYDRILPQFLYWAIQQDLMIPPMEAAECVNNLRILHPYGGLGPLEWMGGEASVPFGAEQSNLADIAKQIRTYTEEAKSPDLTDIQSAIKKAQVLVVIGFGFHRQNIKIVSVDEMSEGTRVFMTVFGIVHENHATVRREMNIGFRLRYTEPEAFPFTGIGLFQNLGLSINLAVS